MKKLNPSFPHLCNIEGARAIYAGIGGQCKYGLSEVYGVRGALCRGPGVLFAGVQR